MFSMKLSQLWTDIPENLIVCLLNGPFDRRIIGIPINNIKERGGVGIIITKVFAFTVFEVMLYLKNGRYIKLATCANLCSEKRKTCSTVVAQA